MKTVKEEIASNLLFYRKRAKMTQDNLAEALGVKKNTISQWENCINSIDVEVLFKICDVLNVGVNDMFGEYATGGDRLSIKEKEIAYAYRSNPAMQEAVDKLLGLAPVVANIEADDELTPAQPEEKPLIGDFTDTDYVRSIIDAQEKADKRNGKKGNAAKSG